MVDVDTAQVYSCEYQLFVQQYFAVCPKAVEPIPFWPAPDNAPNRCSCDLGKVVQNTLGARKGQLSCMKNVTDKTVSNAPDLSNLGNGLDIANRATECACCGASGSISAYVIHSSQFTHRQNRIPTERKKETNRLHTEHGKYVQIPSPPSPAQTSGTTSSHPTTRTYTTPSPTGPGAPATKTSTPENARASASRTPPTNSTSQATTPATARRLCTTFTAQSLRRPAAPLSPGPRPRRPTPLPRRGMTRRPLRARASTVPLRRIPMPSLRRRVLRRLITVLLA